ncbi:MAG: hypothetical protein NHB14_15745 [Desulfosporosinus sp.]|nr:hypothetical protein [Desulfosporosinus sp.]
MLVWELDKLVKMLGDEDIKKGFYEITRFKKGENIQGGVITTLQNLYRKSHKLEEYPIENIISKFLYEMAKRYYKTLDAKNIN